VTNFFMARAIELAIEKVRSKGSGLWKTKPGKVPYGSEG
jgi:hypothetical protein